MSYFTPTDQTDAYDIAVFDFTDAAVDHPQIKRSCFALDHRPLQRPASDIIAYVASGYPTEVQDYDLADTGSIGLKRYSVTCRQSALPGMDDALTELDPIEPPKVPMDGMSGGPVFRVYVDDQEFKVELGGMTLQGGQTRLRALRGDLIFDFLSSVLDHRGI
jgi:hypothetical protein